MNLMYGEMIGSAMIHGGLPILIYVIGTIMVPTMTKSSYTLSLILLSIVGSYIVNFAFISSLQQNSCNGIKSVKSVAIGAAVSAFVTGALIAIPVYVESMRLMFTTFIGMEHKVELEPEDARKQDILNEASLKVWDRKSIPGSAGSSQPTPDEIDTQTRREMAAGATFWSLFAGAYGIAIGARMSTSCGPVQASGGDVP